MSRYAAQHEEATRPGTYPEELTAAEAVEYGEWLDQVNAVNAALPPPEEDGEPCGQCFPDELPAVAF